MAYKNHHFCWHGLMTTDPAKAEAFYPEAVGWKVMKAPMGDGEATMFVAADVPLAHYMQVPMPGMPSHWNNYLRVVDVDASTKAAVANGGKVMMEPTDIPVGRFSVVTSPSGAAVSLFHEADESQAINHPGGVGEIHWVELHSDDVDADLAWLDATFGIKGQGMPLPDGGTYHVLMADGEQMGGAMKKMSPEAPSHWLAWVGVDDVDACVARIKQHGGQVFMEGMDMPGVGRMAVAADPTGGHFGVIQPANPSWG